MKDQDKQNEFLRASKSMLDKGVQQLDDDTKNALAKMRRDVLAGAHKTRQKKSAWPAFPVYQAFAATVAVVAVVGISLHLGLSTSRNDLPQFDDMLLLTETDDLAFYQDLDFYDWLEQEQVDG